MIIPLRAWPLSIFYGIIPYRFQEFTVNFLWEKISLFYPTKLWMVLLLMGLKLRIKFLWFLVIVSLYLTQVLTFSKCCRCQSVVCKETTFNKSTCLSIFREGLKRSEIFHWAPDPPPFPLLVWEKSRKWFIMCFETNSVCSGSPDTWHMAPLLYPSLS